MRSPPPTDPVAVHAGNAAPEVLVVGVGHIALDHHFTVDNAPAPGRKTTARSYRRLVGGMTSNALVAAARLGARAELMSPVGDDETALEFVAHLRREGVGNAGLLRVAGAQSSVSTVIVDGEGERLIVSHRGNALLRAPELGAQAWQARLQGAHVLLADPRCVHWAEAALRQARVQGLLSVLDADTAPRADLQRLVGLATWAVFSAPGLAAYCDGTPERGLAAALTAGAQVAVATQGEFGLLWQRRGGPLQRLPACSVAHVEDTTAAGDVFHGALAVALAEGQDDTAALHFAAAAAALKCQRADAVLGAPLRAELLDYLQHNLQHSLQQGHPAPR
jgi:sulfofructose kinase